MKIFTLERVQVTAIAVVAFVLPLLLWPGLTDYNYTKSIASLVLISGLMILWGLTTWRRTSWTIRVPWTLLPVGGLIVAGALSAIQPTSPLIVTQSILLLVFYILLLWMIANVVRNDRDVRWILLALLASGTLAALYGVFQYFGILPGPSGTAGLHAIVSTMGNRNHLGGFLLYLVFPATILLIQASSQWLKGMTLGALAFAVSCMLLINQMSVRLIFPLISLALIIGAFIFRSPHTLRANRRWLTALAGILLVLFLGPTLITVFDQHPTSSTQPASLPQPSANPEGSLLIDLWEANSGTTRAWDWWIAADMFVDHPITGAGLGNYKLDFIPSKAAFLSTPRGQDYDFYIPSAAQAHNEFVQVGAELGVIGLVMLLGSLITLAVSLWIRLRRNNDENRLPLLLLTMGILAFLAHSLVSFPAHVVGSSLEFVVFCGLALSLAYGSSMSFTWVLRGWKGKAVHIAFVVVGLTVSMFALADARANWLMERGIDQVQAGLFATAESTLIHSLALDFVPRQTYYYLAVAQIQLGKLDEAQINLEKCMTRFIDEASLLNYANLLVNTEQAEAAFEPLALLLASHPRDDIERRALYLHALAISETGDPETAITLIEELLANDPGYETPHIGLGSIYESLDRIDEARATYNVGLEKVEDALTATRSIIVRLGETVPAERASTLQAQLNKLLSERTTLLARLRDLPISTSP